MGAHVLSIQEEEQTITIENEKVVICLDEEETYRLFVILKEVFT